MNIIDEDFARVLRADAVVGLVIPIDHNEQVAAHADKVLGGDILHNTVAATGRRGVGG